MAHVYFTVAGSGDAIQSGSLAAYDTSGDGEHGLVNSGAEDAGDHDVPASTPEVLKGSGQVRLVELRLQLHPQRGLGDHGYYGQYNLQAEVDVKAVEEPNQHLRQLVAVIVQPEHDPKQQQLNPVVQGRFAALLGLLGIGLMAGSRRWVLLDLNWQAGYSDEVEERNRRIWRGQGPLAEGKHEELEVGKPSDEEGCAAPEVHRGKAEGEEEKQGGNREDGDESNGARLGHPPQGIAVSEGGEDRDPDVGEAINLALAPRRGFYKEGQIHEMRQFGRSESGGSGHSSLCTEGGTLTVCG